ncbi:Detected protein of confused Function [Hibiscus syriacus]|uniref:Detected protein of confused Function n=1 Tax=Hibiscus syriacus TaxID=106335 RepID=A0A6A3BMV3_HIBSY|nr:Detected protein of confused Function [Hibiscus syriacus]
MTNLNHGSGFVTGLASRGNTISILAFEVANTMAKGANLLRSLSEQNIQFLKKDVLHSAGVQKLVSTNMKELLSIVAADKRLDIHNSLHKQVRADAETTMKELASLAPHTSELYHELNALDKFEQEYRRKQEEVESLNLPKSSWITGENLMILQSELKQQRKLVRCLKKKSLWSRTLEELLQPHPSIAWSQQHASTFHGNTPPPLNRPTVITNKQSVATVFRLGPGIGLRLEKCGLRVATDHLFKNKWVDRIPYFLPDLRLTRNMSGSGVGYGQGRISTLEPPFRYYCLGAERSRTRRSLLTDTPSLSWISFVVKLKSNIKMDDAFVHDSLRREVETAGGPYVVNGPFVVKLNLRCLESNILCCEVEIGSKIEKLFVDNQRSLRREVELAFGPFVVKLNLRCLESNILRCEVEIGSEIGKLFVDNQRSLRREVELAFGPFVVKLNLRCLESNILCCEVDIGSEIEKLFVDNQWSFVVKLNLRCLESNILRCEVEIGSEIGKLFIDNQRSLRREVELVYLTSAKIKAIFGKWLSLAFDAQRFDGVACMLLYWCSLTPNLRGHTRVV